MPQLPSRGDEWRTKIPKPGEVFQWAVVVFAMCLMALVILAVILAMFGFYG